MTDPPISSSFPPMHVEPSPGLSARIREHIVDGLAPAHGPSAARRWGLGLVGVVVPLVLVGVIYPAASDALLVALGFAFVIGAATYASVARPASRAVTWPTRARFALVPIATFALLWLVTREPTHAAALGTAEHLGCFARGAAISFTPMAALLLLWRRTDPFTPRLSGAVLGGWAGFTGAVGLALSCPVTDSTHILVGHGASVLVGAVLGVLLGHRLLAP